MEPQYSILVYSKYSKNCKRLTEMMRESNVDFRSKLRLQNLCIDNNQVRQRIKASESLSLTSVPCILIIFPDGGVEKYEGPHAFKWTEAMISRLAPPPPPRPVSPPPPPRRQPPSPEEEYDEEPPPPRRKRRSRKQRPPMRPISTVTSIEDIPTDNDEQETSDRHRIPPPRARLRKNRGNYDDETDLFDAPRPNTQRSVKGAVKEKIAPTTAQDTSNIMAKAQELAKGREIIQRTTRPVGQQLQNRP